MKKLFLSLILILTSTLGYSQAASKINNAQNNFSSGQPRVIISCDTLPGGLFRTYPKAQVTWNFSQLTNLPNTLSGHGITDGVPTNRKINGYSLVTDVTLNSTDVGAYPATGNPSGFLTSFTETDPTVPVFAKTLNSFNVIKSSTDVLYEPIFSKNTAFNKNFGTASGTVAEGNDSRIVNAVPNTRTVNGYALSADVTITKSDVGLGNVDNTSDLNKPISTATQTALNGKLSAEVDGSITNELQTLSKVGDNLTISSGNTIALGIPLADYTNTVAISSAGNAIFYITSDKTSTGTALYSNINFVAPLVNDSTVNYTYGWSYNAGTKALTVNVKATPALNVALLSLTLLGVPANAVNGTNVQVLVKGN